MLTETAKAALAKCRQIIGGESDPFAIEWAGMATTERRFWLHYSKVHPAVADRPWCDIGKENRLRIKQAIKRAALRAQSITS